MLRQKPAAVVVETACHPGHGSRPGNLFSCADQIVLGSDGGFFQRVFCQVWRLRLTHCIVWYGQACGGMGGRAC